MLCDELYNELCQLLTNFETGERPVDANDFYSLLVKIQNNWELVVFCHIAKPERKNTRLSSWNN